jgi:hypothetical protein
MKKLKRAIYESPGDIDERVRHRLDEAEQMPPGPARQSVLREIAQLRSYAEMKRCFLAPSGRKSREDGA